MTAFKNVYEKKMTCGKKHIVYICLYKYVSLFFLTLLYKLYFLIHALRLSFDAEPVFCSLFTVFRRPLVVSALPPLQKYVTNISTWIYDIKASLFSVRLWEELDEGTCNARTAAGSSRFKLKLFAGYCWSNPRAFPYFDARGQHNRLLYLGVLSHMAHCSSSVLEVGHAPETSTANRSTEMSAIKMKIRTSKTQKRF